MRACCWSARYFYWCSRYAKCSYGRGGSRPRAILLPIISLANPPTQKRWCMNARRAKNLTEMACITICKVFVWPRGIKSPCCPAWRLPPLTTHPRVVFSSLRDTQNVLLFLIMYDETKACKDRSRKNVEQHRHKKTATKKSWKKSRKTKNSIKKNAKVHSRSFRTVNPIASNSTLWLRFWCYPK